MDTNNNQVNNQVNSQQTSTTTGQVTTPINTQNGNTASGTPASVVPTPVVPTTAPNTAPNSVGTSAPVNSTPPVATPTESNATDTNANNGEIKDADKKLNEVQINYQPPSKFKTVMLVLFFIFLIGFVVFLPEIHNYVEVWKASKNKVVDAKITTGKLVCTLAKSTDNLDLTYESNFIFTDNKLEKLAYSISTRGDVSLDEATLDSENAKCVALKEATNGLSGVSVSCNYSEGLLETKQSFTYSEINKESMDSAYSEAGGIYPEYELNEDMDTIEKNMNASGYTCIRKH